MISSWLRRFLVFTLYCPALQLLVLHFTLFLLPFQVSLLPITLKSKEPPKLLSQKSWYLGIRNGSITRVFWNLNQSIAQKIKNLQLEKFIYITDIKIMFCNTAQYFHSKQLKYSFEKIFSMKFGQVGCKRQKKSFFFK